MNNKRVSTFSARLLRLLFSVIFVLTASEGVVYARGQLKQLSESQPVVREPLYLPETSKVRLITLGFDRFFANILWFNTLNYFGRQLSRGDDYQWLGHMCTLVTDLEPRNRPVVEFCATMLSWVAQESTISTKILHKAIRAEPTYWRFQYLLGFNYWYFHEKPTMAKEILLAASKLDDAPVFLATLAARLSVKEGDPQMALRLLDDMLQRSSDENAKEALREKRTLAVVTRDISVLNNLVERYEQQTGTKVKAFEQLIEAGMLRETPKDPFGDPYRFDPKEREITSVKGGRGLVFNGKTAATGLARFERTYKKKQ